MTAAACARVAVALGAKEPSAIPVMSPIELASFTEGSAQGAIEALSVNESLALLASKGGNFQL